MIVGVAGSSSILARNWPMKTRRYCVSSLCAGPQTEVRIWPWVTTRPAWRARMHRRSYSFGVSFTGAPSLVTRRLSISMARPSTSTCIGAAIERGDLFRLAVARRQDEDRRGGEFARLGEHVLAVHIGQAEIEHDHVGRRIGDEAQRFASGGGMQHLVARRLQRGAQEAEDLRLIVDDKHSKVGHARSCAA